MNPNLTKQNTISAHVSIIRATVLHGSHDAAENLIGDYNVSGNREGH